MRALAIPLILAAVSSTASAGDLKIDLGFTTGGGLHVDLGLRRGYATHVCVPQRVWVAGRYETVQTRVFVPATSREVYEPALYEWRVDSCGRRVRICVRPAGYRVVHVPAHYETRTEQVWRPGYYETVYTCGCDTHRPAHVAVAARPAHRATPVRQAERRFDDRRGWRGRDFDRRDDHRSDDRGRRDRGHD